MNIIEPELKRIHSPDVDDFTNPSLEENKPYCILIQAMFGPKGVDGEESFDFVVCNQLWVDQHGVRSENMDSHQLVVERFDIQQIEAYLLEAASSSVGSNWEEVAAKLSRIGKWEFENYVE